ncbi:putative RNA polymerase II subunit B1 CTD phosphatase rpap2 [Polyodon spathula]|uniref:putative RNA polymerase II subunit B1 CTD phosphatase rpap2 n=1 Tax=Polyodon spathula TaxID=7913 RepID=UPI001B7F07E3|nr:putative RNA polymerase II subunit B1 CTD phosphatase rpap2 [Polyodon spathula]
MAEIQKGRSRSPKSGKRGGKPVKTVTIEEAAKRKEALKEAYRKKYEEQQREWQIVERLLEDNIAEEFLVDCAKFISPANYKDTVEERFILRMCGYPFCQNKLVNIPKQQYKISIKTNKVYDITERKCFCSNFCYKASKHFEAQIPDAPAWMREGERPPDVKLLKQGRSGSSGEEVKIAEDPIAPSQIENPDIDGSSMAPPLPLVDSNAQHLIQKRIVIDKLNRSLKDILGPLQLALCDVSTDLNNLIRTFRFTSSNIIHKNPEWTLISVVLLSMLTAVSPLLQESLKSPTSIEFISTFMKTFNLKDKDFESLVRIIKSHGE